MRKAYDPKLSDGGGWRGGRAVRGRRRQEAAAVTAAAVRCSAYELGNVVLPVSSKLINDVALQTVREQCEA